MAVQDFEGTRVDEISDGIFRISTAVASIAGGGFTYNQYLLVDEEPLLFHTGKRRMFSQVHEAVAHVLPLERLRWISFSHFEADECGALNQFLAAAPHAVPLCGRLLATPSVNDIADREARILAETKSCKLADSECSGSIRRICRMAGKRDSSWSMRPGPCCAVIFSPMAAPTIPRFSRGTFSGRAMPFAASWGISTPHEGDARFAGATRGSETKHARPHARQRLARRRPEFATGAHGRSRSQ